MLVGTHWLELDRRVTGKVILVVPGAKNDVLIQLDGAGRDCESRVSLPSDKLFQLWTKIS